MEEKRTLILGSSSIWRRRVMMKLGAPFEVMAPDIDEKAIRFDDPMELTLEIALAKAEALLDRIDRPALIITADQVAIWRGEVREKPVDAEEARRFLADYSGGEVQTVTAVVVTDVSTRLQVFGIDVAGVRFKPIAPEAIASAIARGDILNSCGAFTIDDPDLASCIERIDGEKESVDGLPLTLLRSLLEQQDYRLP